MPLSDAQKTAMGYLGTIQAAIGKVDPLMKNTVVDFWGFGSSDAQNFKSNTANFTNGGTPFGFLVNIFQMLGSYDSMIEWLTNFLVKSLPALEITIKGVILSNLRNLLTCNIDPRLPDIYRKDEIASLSQSAYGNGIFVNIDSIDFSHMLDMSPLTEDGCVYYFGTYTETEGEPVKKDWKNYTAKEKFNFIKSGGKQTPDTLMAVKKKHFVNVYKLARAYDFNAFLWFVIHKGKLPLPIYASIDVTDESASITRSLQNVLSIPGEEPTKISKLVYNKKENEYVDGQELKFFGSAFKAEHSKALLAGTTISTSYNNEHGKPIIPSRLVQMATSVSLTTLDKIYTGQTIDENSEEQEGTEEATVIFVPISDDCYSVNWYADPSNYYAYNLSKPKAKRPQQSYNESKPICNIRYLNQGRGANIAANHKLLVSVPPKPFVTYTYDLGLDDLYSFPLVKKILFDEDGNPSKNGHYSLRNFTSEGLPYVRAMEESVPGSVCNIWLNRFIDMFAIDSPGSHTNFDAETAMFSGATGANNYKFFSSILQHGKRILSSYRKKIDSMVSVEDFQKTFNVPESGSSEELKREYNEQIISDSAYYEQLKKDLLYADGNAEKYADNCVMSKYTKHDLEEFGSRINTCYIIFRDALNRASALKSSENEGQNPDYITFERFKVGDIDDCVLYVNRKTGEYTLGSETIERGGRIKKKESYKAHLQECYAGLTVYEFNYDLIMSMKLFDARVLATSLVSALFNLSVGVGASVRMPSLWGNEEASMVRSIITDVINASDETEITDCFFTFTNEKYEDLISKAEKKYLETGSINTPSLRNVKVNTKPLMDILDEYDENGTIEEQTDTISRFFKQASVTFTEDSEDLTDTDKNHAQVKFATNLIGALAGVLIEAVLTPKVMLAYQINREMAGGDITDYQNFKEFLGGMKMLIVAMVKEIRDIIIKELMDKAMQLINQLITQFGIALLKEQLQVYKELFDKLMKDCVPNLMMIMSMFKRAPRTLVDTTLPVVEYADIMSNLSDAPESTEGTEPIIDNCG